MVNVSALFFQTKKGKQSEGVCRQLKSFIDHYSSHSTPKQCVPCNFWECMGSEKWQVNSETENGNIGKKPNLNQERKHWNSCIVKSISWEKKNLTKFNILTHLHFQNSNLIILFLDFFGLWYVFKYQSSDFFLCVYFFQLQLILLLLFWFSFSTFCHCFGIRTGQGLGHEYLYQSQIG